jgi:hypothetical protein
MVSSVLHAIETILAHAIHVGHAAGGIQDEQHVGAYAGGDVDVAEIDFGVVCFYLDRNPGERADDERDEQMAATPRIHRCDLLRQQGTVRSRRCYSGTAPA